MGANRSRRLAGPFLPASTLLPLLAVVAVATRPGFLRAWQDDDPSPYSEARLISELSAIQPGQPFWTAVYFELEEGWHNYWRNAGDSGIPTSVTWDLPLGFTAGEIQWPVPTRIAAPPLVDYGYSGEVALLVEITPPPDLPTDTAVVLKATADWLVCKEICLPAYQELSLELPVTTGPARADPETADLFRRTREELPRHLDEWTATAESTGDGYRLQVEAVGHDRPPPAAVYFFPSEESVLDHAAPQVVEGLPGGLSLTLKRSAYAVAPSAVLRGVLLAEEGGWDEAGAVRGLAVEAPVRMAPSGTGEGGAEATLSLALAGLFAFLGGILLNLMPCVFPVLSLKVLSAVRQGGEDRARIRLQGVVFGIGVIVTFLALALLLLLLREGGARLGWGFQLQQPLFVAGMAALFFAIGLNLMGVFEVGTVLTRLGGRSGEPSGYGEALASGVLATVIATPCTAPFMGAALGVALTRATPETLMIFGFLGLGMALPYVALSFAPGLLERLPRPGAWMETLRNLLAFPMFATVIWLVWVFGQQTGIAGVAYLLGAFLAVTAAAWMVGRWHRTDLRSGRVARGISLIALLLAGLLAFRGSGQEPPELDGGVWTPYTEGALRAALAGGRPAFVDFTAAWCLTCQVNERVVLSSDTVLEAFRKGNVALFRADWTRQDPEITAALEALGRSGVPVYALYSGRRGAPPRLLPALLTEQIVLDALQEALSPAPEGSISSPQVR